VEQEGTLESENLEEPIVSEIISEPTSEEAPKSKVRFGKGFFSKRKQEPQEDVNE
jgi:hypothetical protein